ncbi:E3 ubiquitin-protein ligase RBBP6-like [Thalassophryne amazonica]|uniref:E3 ubiquitin-protein ligase RBBP6-like n=1 Tax=Thalassophryne amazonica TaxID=390379 RepID=UPI001470F718|nr:E3 ubiquitin-protein ligase RBBP6-like [Thalassophryne amazonica]
MDVAFAAVFKHLPTVTLIFQLVDHHLPDTYVCFRCGHGGHHIRDCPTHQDESFQPLKRMKRSSGIPRSFMMEVDDPSVEGAMVTITGELVVSAIHAEAYRCKKKERPPFLPQDPPTPKKKDEPIPEVVCCPICHELLREAVITPCCGNSFCDQCISDVLLDSEQQECPVCHTSVSPVAVVPNVCVRKVSVKCIHRRFLAAFT